ncbi:hypothetical protein AAFN47_11115 [Hoeflea sp. CAU 1731]
MPHEQLSENVRPIIERLIELLETSRPDGGSETEAGKLEKAGEAIDLLWTLADQLTGWAEAHLTGHSMVFTMPELAKFLEKRMKIKFGPDSHALEHIGNLFQWEPELYHSGDTHRFSSGDDPELKADKGLELLDSYQQALNAYTARHVKKTRKGVVEKPDLVSTVAFRALVNSMLGQRQGSRNFWRHELQQALRKFEDGEIDPIFQPERKGRWGQPYSLKEWKLQAVRQVVFRVGNGMKKYEALEEVADALHLKSDETLKTWEKKLRKDTEISEDLTYCRLAGKYDSDQNTEGYTMSISPSELSNLADEYDLHRIEFLGAIIKGTSLETIRLNIRAFQTKL